EKIFKEVKEKTGKQPSTSLEKLLKTEIGKKIQEKTGKIVDFHRPDIMAILDTRYDDVRLQISSIYIYGRYRKLVRGIPQTVWHCRKCRGKGCRYCHFSGKMYETSVQELIAEPVLKVSGGTKTSFHGMGREDIDALMLGNGRPFVLEIKEPKKRVLDYEKLEKEVNKAHPGLVEILGLRSSSHEEVVKIKSSNYPKRYRVKVKCAQKVEEAKLKKAFQTLTGAVIEQRTPLRVKHRRADKVRKRKVLEIEGRILDDHTLEIEVKGESGLYIKELVHGDGGRTKPSLSELLENECEVETLDVIWIYDQE
ncbi:MAG TPA: tRNA pseudouridine(54/55) synthase Pus10, partial [Thermoplasmata archaeon]|nr:tRNA pseudouridine(54/55) synthase Pus10 [Thermoplasmata archaeon]